MNHSRLPVPGKVVSNRKLINNHYLMTVNLPESIVNPLPGQFIMVMLNRRGEFFLGRPFSIYNYNRRRNKATIDILYQVVGRGTRLMAELERGDTLGIFGPHGKSFDMFPHARNVILIAGGMGVAPISCLASYYKKNMKSFNGNIICYSGARTSDHLLGMDRLKATCSSVHISTDDGSVGYRGAVTELFAGELPGYEPDQCVLYACGPSPMLKRLSEILKGHAIPCQVLLEQRMACGVGACLGCVVEVKKAGEESQYARVCVDGPVFDIQNINWNTTLGEP